MPASVPRQRPAAAASSVQGVRGAQYSCGIDHRDLGGLGLPPASRFQAAIRIDHGWADSGAPGECGYRLDGVVECAVAPIRVDLCAIAGAVDGDAEAAHAPVQAGGVFGRPSRKAGLIGG